jgi:predicted TPR repeat methyltransferase
VLNTLKDIFRTYLASQLRKPTGLFGNIISNRMQKMNEPIYKWMLSILNFAGVKNVLEIGYGTGVMMNRILNLYENVEIYGIDFSKVMFNKAELYNEKYIKEGKIHLELGNLLDYNPAAVKFDIVYCLNVIYFWMELGPYLEKIFSLMNNGAVLYLYMRDPKYFKNHSVGKTGIFIQHEKETIQSQMELTGFKQVDFIENKIKAINCFCVKAIK